MQCDKRLADHLYKAHSIHVEKSSILPISSVETTDDICPSNTLTTNADHSTSEVIDGASNSVNTETSSVLSVSTKRLKTNSSEDTDQSGVITSEVLVDSPWQWQVRDGRLKKRHNEGAYRSLFPSSHDHDLVQTDDPIQTEEDSTQLGHYDSENTVDVESSMLEINSYIGLTSTPYPFPVAEDLNSSDNTTTFQVQPWQISDDSPLPTAECVVYSEQDQSKLRSCRILKEKREKEINWTATILLAFYHKINVDIVEESLICNKHYSQWYRFYEKSTGYVTDLFPVSCSHTPNIGDTCQVSVMKSILPQVSLPADRSLSSSTLDVVSLVTAPSHNTVINTSGETVLEIIVGAKLGMLSTSDILSISAVNNSFRQKQVIWKHLCIRKFGIYRCFNDVSYKETFLRIIQERLQLEKELDICIPENKMSIREFQCYLSKSFVDQLKPNSELQTLLRDEGISRIPKNSELLVFIAAKMLRKFLDQQASCTRNCKATFDTSGVRLGAEYYRIPLTERIYDTVLTSTRTERQKTLSAAKSAEKVWHKVIMHGIRLQNLRKDNITPLHRIITQVFSNFHSPELLTIGNKSGLSLSYTNDYLYNKKARASCEENCETFLNSVDSNMHFWTIDNLETVMKWMNMLKEGDKLTHFMTAMLVYIKGHQQITDFYPKRKEHTLSKSQLKPTEKDENIFTEFCEVVYQYANKLNDVIPEGAEQYIESLSKSSTNEQSTSNEQKSKCPKIDKEALPRKRILHESFEGNLYGNRNVKTTLHYHRVLELYSGDMFQVKQLVETLMKDYGIQKVKPLPCPENHPPSPMLFASVPTQLANGKTQAPAFLYRNIWGVIENTTEIISAGDQDLVKDETKVSKILESIASQLQTDKLAIHSALQVLSLIEEGVLKAQSQLYLLRAELYRKQGLFLAASKNYMTFLNCENDRDGTTNVEYVTCAKVNLAIAKYKLGLIHHTVSICNELMTNAQSYV